MRTRCLVKCRVILSWAFVKGKSGQTMKTMLLELFVCFRSSWSFVRKNPEKYENNWCHKGLNMCSISLWHVVLCKCSFLSSSALFVQCLCDLCSCRASVTPCVQSVSKCIHRIIPVSSPQCFRPCWGRFVVFSVFAARHRSLEKCSLNKVWSSHYCRPQRAPPVRPLEPLTGDSLLGVVGEGNRAGFNL